MIGATEGQGALRARGVAKSYGACHALFASDLTLRSGQRTFVCGENGAGKSTLLRIAAGLIAPDQGQVSVQGEVLQEHSPSAARARGVCMVEQHFALIPSFTVMENVILGREPQRGLRRLHTTEVRDQILRLGTEIGVKIDPDAQTGDLGVAAQQAVEIVRALYWGAKVLILDEPTAVLSPREAERLYRVVRALASAGTAVAVVTHKLDEVRAHADNVIVLRKGRVVSTTDMPDAPEARAVVTAQIATEMMGGEVPGAPSQRVEDKGGEHKGVEDGESAGRSVLLRLRDVHMGARLRGVDLEVHAGEIVGVAGVEGSGQHELVAVSQGGAPDRGEVERPGPQDVSVVPEDRQAQGLVLPASLRDNVLMGEFDAFTRFGVLDKGGMNAEARRRLDAVGAGGLDLLQSAASLSGGNQQKVVFARALGRAGARLLVCAYPTRGVDFAASHTLHDKLRAARAQGFGVLLISADTDELRALSDRIVVMFAGRITHEFPGDAPDTVLGPAMLGSDGPSQVTE